MSQKVVLALGGNAILQPKQEPTYENQYENVYSAATSMVDLIKAGHEIIVTHGNGPQVGLIIAQNEAAKADIKPMPVFVSSAESQGMIGFMLEQALKNKLKEANIDKNVVSLLTMTEVDKDDEAFQNPTKPIGVFFTEEEAKRMEEELGYDMKEDAGRGYRRVVPSPEPKLIHGVEEIKTLSEQSIVISSGGGGIPVWRDEDGVIHGVDAVIDKDRSALKLALQSDANKLMILTDVPNALINYGTENETKLERVTVEEMERYIEEGHFASGSMLPKVEAAIGFAKSGEGKESIICSLSDAVKALAGEAGTHITL